MSKLADRLFSLRKENNLTQQELADNLKEKYSNIDTNKGMISKYEKGIHEPGFSFIDCVSDYFGVTTDWLMGRSDQKYFSDNVKQKRLPILGTIAAGTPILAQPDVQGYEFVDERDCSDFCLRVKGNSMINARIFDGDLVFIHKQSEVENGEIAAIQIDNEEVTLKRFYLESGKIRLHSENPTMPDMIFQKKDNKSIKILGKVKFVKFEAR